ncbi:hypothetical protein [Cerasicoccus maritimus]|uniref:hypothetical protein n=1 Tax=Cerasicoccus maritimus TaxID=490089 RepID=UPI002852B503|nr:hypothetical protein [Cerasicoccus maritimus]
MNTDSTSNEPPAMPPPLPNQQGARTTTVQARDIEISAQAETYEEADASAPRERSGWPALPTLLRWLGATTLLASAFTFLISNWESTEELQRYAQFLGLTVLLTGCGWFCISRWKDDKGARTFFALSAALLPAHFCQLGAMLFAKFRGQESFNGFYEAFAFQDPGVWLWPTIGGALLLLIPMTYLGFASMARKDARKLTLVYFLSNATLLITTRMPDLVALIGFAQLGGLIFADRKYFASQSRLQTWDGVAMRSLLFAPFGLLVGRNLMLHAGESELLISLLATTLATVLFTGVPRVIKNKTMAELSRVAALAPAIVAWSMFASCFELGGHAWEMPLIVLPSALIAIGMSTRMSTLAKPTRRTAVVVAISAALLQMVSTESIYASLLAIATSIIVILASYRMRERWVFRIGIGGLALSILYHLRYAVELYQGDWIWLSLAGTGVLVILSSSYLERYGRQGMNSIKTLHHKVSGWK